MAASRKRRTMGIKKPRQRKKKSVQLDLFKVPEIGFEQYIWNQFEKEVNQLHADGFYSIDETWWRSRFYETISYPNHKRNKKGFDFEQKANQCWIFLWNTYQKEMMNYENKKSRDSSPQD